MNIIEAVKDNKKVKSIICWSQQLYTKYRNIDKRIDWWNNVFNATPLSEEERIEIRKQLSPEDVCIIIYTSGTTGPPKGAMITNKGIIKLIRAWSSCTRPYYEDDLRIGYLPLPHAAERVLGFYGGINVGMRCAVCTEFSKLFEELEEVRPSVIGGVPRIFEKAYARIHDEISNKAKIVQIIFHWAIKIGTLKASKMLKKEKISLLLNVKYLLADILVFKKIRNKFLGGRAIQFITGAAPISIEILEFFWGIGLQIYEAYGLTEATCITHTNTSKSIKLGTVGKSLPGCQHKIANDGELLIKCEWIFKGYYKNEESTKKTIIDGWLHTGDIGRIDNDGYLTITDRKKHIIITAGGKNVTPANIENAIKNQDPLISAVHVHGDKRNYITALIAPSSIETLQFGAKYGMIDTLTLSKFIQRIMNNPQIQHEDINEIIEKIVQLDEYKERIKRAVEKGNSLLSHVEQVKRFYILNREFSQMEGELTPSLKMKRNKIEKKYSNILDRIYMEED